MKKIVAVYDKDDEYGRRLAEYLNRKESIPFSIIFFMSEESLVSFAQEHIIDMLLIEEASMTEEIKKLSIGEYVYLTRNKDCTADKKSKVVYKFQSSDYVVRELISYYDAKQSENKITLKRDIVIIGIYSPIARCQKSSFALILGEILSRNRMVFLMSLDEFSGWELLFGKVFKKDLTDALFYQAQGQIKSQLEYLTERWHNMDLLPPMRYPENLYEAGNSELIFELVKEIASVSQYDVMILDMGCNASLALKLIALCQKVYMPVLDDMISRGKIAAFEEWMSLKRQTELLERIIKVKLPVCCHKSREINSNQDMYLEQLLWGELGDYIRMLVKGEW